MQGVGLSAEDRGVTAPQMHTAVREAWQSVSSKDRIRARSFETYVTRLLYPLVENDTLHHFIHRRLLSHPLH